jgi:hypothetical protein
MGEKVATHASNSKCAVYKLVSDLTAGAKIGPTQFPGLNGIVNFFNEFLIEHKNLKGDLNIAQLLKYLQMSNKYKPGYLKDSIDPIITKYQDQEMDSLNPASANKIKPSSMHLKMKRFAKNWQREGFQIGDFTGKISKGLISTQLIASILNKESGDTDIGKLLPAEMTRIDSDEIQKILDRIKLISTQLDSETQTVSDTLDKYENPKLFRSVALISI